MDRKVFLQGIGRSVIILVLFLLTGFLIRRHKVSSSGSCYTSTSCSGCKSFPACKKHRVINPVNDAKK